MVILFANQKGGVGKSTLCIHYANYLRAHQMNVVIFDTDFQQTIYTLRQKELAAHDIKPGDEYENNSELKQKFFTYYEIIADDDLKTAYEGIRSFNQLDADDEQIILVDLPGKLNDDNLISLFQIADFIVIPFQYERAVLESTSVFIRILLMPEFKIKTQMVFMPNKIDNRKRYDKGDVNEILLQYGVVSPEIPDRKCLSYLSTMVDCLTPEQWGAFGNAFDFLSDLYNVKIKDRK